MHCRRPSQLLQGVEDRRVYFVNSYRATPSDANADWTLATSNYGGGDFVSAVGKGQVDRAHFLSNRCPAPLCLYSYAEFATAAAIVLKSG